MTKGRLPLRPAVRVYTVDDGLPQNTVASLAFDRDGYLWAGTQDGLARYDGRAWKAVAVPCARRSTWVRKLLAGSDGSLWVATNGGGLARLLDGAWTLYDTTSGLPHNQVRAVLETRAEDGSPVIWAGTGGGLGRLHRGRWSVFDASSGLPDAPVSALAGSVAPDGSPSIWVGTYGSGIVRLEGRRWTALEGVPHEYVWSLLETVEAGERTLWAGTQSGALARYASGAWRSCAEEAGRSLVGVFDMHEARTPDGRRELWLATLGDGVSRLSGGEWEHFDTSTGLPNDGVACVAENWAAGGPRSVWLGTTGGGLARLTFGQWSSLGAVEGMPDAMALALLETRDDGGEREIWIGTQGRGLVRLGADGCTVFDTSNGLPHDVVVSLLETRGRDGTRSVWAGTWDGGLARLRDGVWTVEDVSTGLPHNGVLCLLATEGDDGEPVVWAGTEGGGLAKLEGGRWAVFDDSSGVPHRGVFSLLETRDETGRSTMWAGTQGGIVRLDDDGVRVYGASSGLPNDWVFGLFEERAADGSRYLWAGTQGGGAAYLDLDDEAARWRVLDDTTVPALPNNTVYAIRADRYGRLYLFTNRGVARLDRDRLASRNYTTESGLPNNECNAGAVLVDSLGRVWVGTVGGVGIFDPEREVEDREPKPLRLERASVEPAGREIAPRDSLAHDENDVAFEYALLSLFREAETRYRTWLEGFDRGPSVWTAEARRSYTNLPEGRYAFHVWGRDAEGNISGPVRLPFRVRAAPWRTWSAYALYAGAAAGAGYAAVRWRMEALERRNRELEAGIAERTAELAEKVEQLEASERAALEASRAKSVFLSNMSHELRTPLNAVLGFAQLLDRDTSLAAGQREQLAAIRRSGEHLLGLINDVLSIAKIEAGKVTLQRSPFDLGRSIASVEEMIRIPARAKGLAFLVDVAPDLPGRVVGDDGKLRQVLINLLGNAVKFTEEGGIALRARWRDGRGEFEVSDTGRGIAPEEQPTLFEAFVQTESGRQSREGTGLGLAISRNFVELMGGEISVRSSVGQGTTFSFSVDLPRDAGAGEEALERRVVAIAPGERTYKIIVADDSAENRHVLASLLGSVGFLVREAADGAQAVALWDDWHPDLIWMDLRMPVLDGLEATREIRRRETSDAGRQTSGDDTDRCKIVILTASAFEHDLEAIERAGCDGFVAKPYREASIFEALGQHLGVELVYESVAPATRSTSGGIDLARLPGPWRASFARVLVAGDVAEAMALLDQLGDDPIAGDLSALVRAYRFEEILSALELERDSRG